MTAVVGIGEGGTGGGDGRGACTRDEVCYMGNAVPAAVGSVHF